jgi:ferredoxin
MGYLRMGYLISPGHPKESELSQAQEFGLAVASRLSGNKYAKPEEDPGPKAIYRLERFLANRWMCKQIFSRVFNVDKKKCTNCGVCIKLCPVKNITEIRSGYPAWGRNCIACFTCELNCPEDAVSSPIDWPIFRPLLLYNVRKASRDSALDHVRVIHSKGSTKEI